MFNRMKQAARSVAFMLALSAWAFASARAVAPEPNQWDYGRTWFCSSTECVQWYGMDPGQETYPTGATAECPTEFMVDYWWEDLGIGSYCTINWPD